MPLHSIAPSSLASFKFVLPFWYRLTQVVLKKWPLNGCSSVVVTYIHTFNGPFSRTTWVSQYQKGKANLDFTK